MNDKLYGLDDIFEGWMIREIFREVTAWVHDKPMYNFYAEIVGPSGSGNAFGTWAENPRLALHKAIQKARGEND